MIMDEERTRSQSFNPKKTSQLDKTSFCLCQLSTQADNSMSYVNMPLL